MKINQKTAISTAKALLVPYEKHHVVQYHSWMQDPAIQEATASEPLSLEEEYENQQSWRTAADKLTFIVCEGGGVGVGVDSQASSVRFVTAQEQDASAHMVGDVNLFLYPDSHGHEDVDCTCSCSSSSSATLIYGEINVMVAAPEQRRRGRGEAAVRALLLYIEAHLDDILREYSTATGKGGDGGDGTQQDGRRAARARLRALTAKIHEGNGVSRALFAKLGFRQVGEVDYFGEVSMVLDWPVTTTTATAAAGGVGFVGKDEDWALAGREYRELEYHIVGEKSQLSYPVGK